MQSSRKHVSLVDVAASVAAMKCPTSNQTGVNDIVYLVDRFCYVYEYLGRFLWLLAICLYETTAVRCLKFVFVVIVPAIVVGCMQHGAKYNNKTK